MVNDFHNFLVTLTLCLSPFSLGGKRNVLPMRSSGSKVGIGLDPDGFSSFLDLMKTVGVLCFGEELSECSSGDPEENCLQKGQKMERPPLHVVQAYGWE